MKKQNRKRFKNFTRNTVLVMISAWIGVALTQLVFQLSSLPYPEPKWLSLPFAAIFSALVCWRGKDVMNAIFKTKADGKMEV
jgi:hypothetical protein